MGEFVRAWFPDGVAFLCEARRKGREMGCGNVPKQSKQRKRGAERVIVSENIEGKRGGRTGITG